MTVTDTLSQTPATTQSGLGFDAVLRTHEAVSRILSETPTWFYPLLNAKAGVEVIIKHENVQPVSAFKVRGGMTLMAALSPEERRHDVVTASTGNHAQSLAQADTHSEVPMTVIVPVDTPAYKVATVHALGVRVVIEGETICESLAHAETLTLHKGMCMVSPGDEPAIVLGRATVYLEFLRHHPDPGAVYAPVGSGSGAAGAYLVRDALTPECWIIGIQSSTVPAAHRAWTSGEPATVHGRTRVAGLAVGASFIPTQSVPGRSPSDFILVDDDAIQGVVSLLATHTHILAEGAGVTSLAGLMTDPTRQGRRVVICTGDNADDYELAGTSIGISTRTAVGIDATLNC